MTHQDASRRSFLGLVGAGAVVGACSNRQGAADTNNSGSSGANGGGTPSTAQYRESPLLASRVAAGELPPLKDRLPKNPYVLRPGLLVGDEFVDWHPGKFGGTLEVSWSEGSHIFLGTIEPLLWASNGFGYSDGAAIEGNVVEGVEVNADSTVFTFHLREGMRWSDGRPVTMDDIRFAFEDVLSNPKITQTLPTYLRGGRQPTAAPAKLTAVDDWTFSLSFDRPYGAFPAQLAIAEWRSYGDIIKPRHYLEQFHEKYASKAKLAQLLKAASLPADQWFNLFNTKQFTFYVDVSAERFKGHPSLTAWVMTESTDGVYQFERNPYYFKVDTEGSQLPYIDKIRAQAVKDVQTVTSRALFGEFDYAGEFMSLRQISLVAEKADKGEVTMHVGRMHRLPVNLELNLTYPDPTWRKVVQDQRFRQALSMAINRQEIVENFYLGEFASPSEETNPNTYDVAQANRLLDEMGLDSKDSQGFRLGPDGRRFAVPIESFALSEDFLPFTELIAEYWNKVGVYTSTRKIAVNVWSERFLANELKAFALLQHHDIWPSAGWDDYLPGAWGPKWHEWYTSGGKKGEEPPAGVKELYELNSQFTAAPLGSAESKAAIDAIKKSCRENIWTFNPVEHSYYPTFWSKRIKNVPSGIKEDVFGIVVNISMEQWYIDE